MPTAILKGLQSAWALTRKAASSAGKKVSNKFSNGLLNGMKAVNSLSQPRTPPEQSQGIFGWQAFSSDTGSIMGWVGVIVVVGLLITMWFSDPNATNFVTNMP